MASRKTGHGHESTPWQARASLNGKSIFLGYYTTEGEAREAERVFRCRHNIPPSIGECVALLRRVQACCDKSPDLGLPLPLTLMDHIDSALARFDDK